MKAGIICEYDPFHKGHDYHLAKTLQAMPSCSQNAVIAVMSGNYVQRAQPAMWDKFTRTRMALSSGVSMVLELPTLYAAATAEWFAFGGVSLLYHSHMIDALSFGMEDESHLPVLKRASSLLFPEDPAYQTLLRRYLSEPLPFAQARQRALEDLLGQALPTGPNDVLVLEYLKAIRRLEQENILQETGRGLLVVGISWEDMMDMYEIRMQIEGLAARRAAERITDAELAAMRDTLDLQRYYVEKGGESNSAQIKNLDAQFHEQLYQNSGSKAYCDTLLSLHKKITKFRMASVSKKSRALQSLAEHETIYQALAAHDGEAAARAATEHVRQARERIRTIETKEN